MEKAVLFDFDGVLTVDKSGSTTITNYISQRTGLPLDLVKTSYYKHNKALLAGRIVHGDMWAQFCADVGQAIPYEVLTDSFLHTALDERMLVLAWALKADHKIGLVTENKLDRIETILRAKELAPLFDTVIVSAEGYRNKRTPDMFEAAMARLGVQAEECVFIDNNGANLVAPGELGMRTILFDDETRDFEKLQRELSEALGRRLPYLPNGGVGELPASLRLVLEGNGHGSPPSCFHFFRVLYCMCCFSSCNFLGGDIVVFRYRHAT